MKPYDLTEDDKAEIIEMLPLLFPILYDLTNPFRRALERSTMAGETPARKSPSEHLLNLFDQHELDPVALNAIASEFKELAEFVVGYLPSGPEQTVCLRHLLDAKHAAVRALITDETPVKSE